MRTLTTTTRPLLGRLAALLLTLVTSLGTARAQAPAWQQAFLSTNVLPDAGTSLARAVATDASGNVFVAGSFTEQVAFGTTILTSAGGTDAFVAKWQPSTNTWLWATSGGGTADEVANGVAVSGSNVYLVGTFNSSASPTLAGMTLTGAGGTDMFVAKYSDQGSTVAAGWAASGGGTGADVGNGIAASTSGVFVTGTFVSNTTAVVAGMGLAGTGGTDAFLAKYTDNGSTATGAWSLAQGGTGADYGAGLALSGSNLYFTGSFASGGSASFGGRTLAGAGNQDAVLAKYAVGGGAPTGTWAVSGGGNSADQGLGVAVSGSSVYLTGAFSSASSASFAGASLTGAGGTDMVVAKYSDGGSTVTNGWARSGGGTRNDYGYGVAASSGSVYVTGSYAYNTSTSASTNAVFAGVSLPDPTVTDAFVVRYTDQGTTAANGWAVAGGGGSYDYGYGVALSGTALYTALASGENVFRAGSTLCGMPSASLIGQHLASTGAWQKLAMPWQTTSVSTSINSVTTDASGNVFVAGSFSGQISFGNTVLVSAGYIDMFVAKWNAATGSWAWGTSSGGYDVDVAYGLAVNGSNVYVTGYYSSSGVYPDSNPQIGGVSMPRGGGRDIFVAKFIDQGTSVSTGWVVGTGSPGVDQGRGIAVSGTSVYVTGMFSGISGIQIAGTTLAGAGSSGTGQGVSDAFVAKFIDNGSTAGNGWAVGAGGGGGDAGNRIALNGNSLYVSGTFASGLNAVVAGVGLTGAGGTDAFLAKYTDVGSNVTENWAVEAGGAGAEADPSVAVEGSNVYLLSNFESATATVANTTVTNNGSIGADLFLAKYTDQGMAASPGWAVSAGGSGIDNGNDLRVSGNAVYVAGQYSRSFMGGADPVVAGTTLTGIGGAFVAKYLDNGATVDNGWVTTSTSSSTNSGAVGSTLTLRGAAVYLAGRAVPTVMFGGLTLGRDMPISLPYVARLDDIVPVLTAVAPTSGAVGSPITLTGTNLTGTTSISFAGGTVSSGFVVNGAGTSITGVVVPTGATTGPVTVTTTNGTSNSLIFTVTAPQLAVRQGSTSYPSGGTAYSFGTQTVNITSTAVSFTLSNAGTAPLPISSITTTGDFALTGTAPTSVAAGGTAPVAVTFRPTATGARPGTLVITSSLGTYTVNLSGTGQAAAPGLSGLSPTNGPVSTSVTISGLNLLGATSVSFGSTAQTTITSNTGTSLIVAVPAGLTPGAVSVTVTTPSGTSSGLTFTVTAPQLAITQGGSSYPSGGTAYSFGTVLVGSTSAATSFTLTNAGTAPLSISSVVASGDFATSGTVPTGAAANGGTATLGLTFAPTASGSRTGTVVISSNAGTYTLNLSGTGQTPAPALTSISPTSALAGSTVALTGTNLTGAYAVSFTQGATSRSVTSGYTVSSTSITGIVVPASLSPGAYVVYTSNLNGVSNGVAFTVLTPAPTISSFSVDHGIVGEVITITGTNLGSATSVSFGGVSQATITNNTATSLTFAVPAGAITGPVTVTTPGGPSNGLVFYVLHDLTISTGTTASPVVITPDDYRNIVVEGTGAAVIQTEAVVFGSLTVQAGGYLNTNCGAVTGMGSFTLTAGATLAICDANGLRAIGNSGPVRVTGTRSFSTGAHYVYNGSGAQETGSGLPATVRSITTTTNSPLTLTLPVSISQTLTIGAAGNLNLAGQALTLLSNATGTALVVNSGTGVVTGGTATVQRYLTPTNPGMGYRHYSSPVRGNTLADLQTGTFTPVFNTAYNTSAQPNYVTPFPTVLGYDQARVAGPASTYSGFDKGWYSPATGTSTPASFTVGQGYSVNLAGTEKVDFTGTLNTGTYAVNLARTTGPTAAAGGWALVGNPYPAPIDWTRIVPADRPGLDAAMYVFESNSAYGGTYRTYVNSIGSGSPLIGTAQGFWVQVSTGQTAGALTFRNAHRLTDYATQVPVRRTAADPRPQLQLTLAGQGLTDEVYLYAEAGATAGVDASFDAVKLLNPHGLNVATLTAAGPALAIDGRADLTNATTIPLQVGVPAAGSYTFTAAALQNLVPGTTLVLVDALRNTRTVLTAGASYGFTTTATTLPGRFFLNLAPAGALATAAGALAAQVLLYPNPAHGTATLQVPAGLRTGPAVLLNALGQTVRTLLLDSASTTVDLRGLAAGVYTLRLTAATGTITRRLVVE